MDGALQRLLDSIPQPRREPSPVLETPSVRLEVSATESFPIGVFLRNISFGGKPAGTTRLALEDRPAERGAPFEETATLPEAGPCAVYFGYHVPWSGARSSPEVPDLGQLLAWATTEAVERSRRSVAPPLEPPAATAMASGRFFQQIAWSGATSS